VKWLRYLKYILIHKWYVMLMCFRFGLIWRGVVHDLSKFYPSEFIPYIEHFYGKKAKKWRDNTGYYKPSDTGDLNFDRAWNYHANRNDHHWQFWAIPEYDSVKALEMPEKCVKEMICDWWGANKAQGHGGWGGPDGVRVWYMKNEYKMVLHINSRLMVERILNEISG